MEAAVVQMQVKAGSLSTTLYTTLMYILYIAIRSILYKINDLEFVWGVKYYSEQVYK